MITYAWILLKSKRRRKWKEKYKRILFAVYCNYKDWAPPFIMLVLFVFLHICRLINRLAWPSVTWERARSFLVVTSTNYSIPVSKFQRKLFLKLGTVCEQGWIASWKLNWWFSQKIWLGVKCSEVLRPPRTNMFTGLSTCWWLRRDVVAQW
jgi:hypothetical protein